MEQDWKPGDVAMVMRDGKPTVAIRMARSHGGLDWQTAYGANVYDDPRPLVIFDPDRLVHGVNGPLLGDLLYAEASQTENNEPTATRSIAVLRALANAVDAVVNRKPEEPKGLGAVVEDADDEFWVRSHCEPRPWTRPHLSGTYEWTQIAAVRVLSEGVTP